MCIITGNIESVSKTQLFCGLNSNKTKQITIYSNDVNSLDNNAMILPVPNPNSLEFYDLTNNKDFFKLCSKCFYDEEASFLYSATKSCRNYLKVIDVGSYKISVANNLDDLRHINTNVFTISDNLNNMLSKTYSASHFGFIICALKKGNHTYHPLAYSHNVYRGKAFLPCKHYHATHYTTNSNNKIADDWDHDVYLYNMDPSEQIKSMNNKKWIFSDHIDVKDKLNLDFILGECTQFHKLTIKDTHPNIDIICKI